MMRKEIVVAILAGALFGLVIAFGIWRANSSFSNQKTANDQASPTPLTITSKGLAIAKPNHLHVSGKSTISVSGIAKANLPLVITNSDSSYITTSDANGTFDQEVDLTGGINEITVFSFDNAQISQKALLVIYSSEFATTTTNVEDKVETAKETPVAYLGTLTDITKNTLQINKFLYAKADKKEASQIQQLSVNDDTSFAKITKTTKEVKFEDLAIGDFVIAMGFTNGNHVLKTQRILVTEPFKEAQKEIKVVNFSEIDKKQITTKTKIYSYSQNDDKVKTIKSSDLKPENKVIVISENNLTQGIYLLQ